MSRLYRLPGTDTFTPDVDLYLKHWEKFELKALSFFPGYVVSGFDPGVTLYKWGKNGLGQDVVHDRVTLSVEAVQTLSAPTPASVTNAKKLVKRSRGG